MRPISTLGMNRPEPRDPGPDPVLTWLPISELCIDPDYQREINRDGRRAIEAIASKFEWSKFSAVVVSPISGGRFAVIDGQHRTTAAKLIGITSVPCIVQSLDRAGQAAAFAAINGSVTKITPWHVYKAALAAGEGWAVVLQRTAANASCRVMTANRSAKDKSGGELYGINTLRLLVKRHGEALVTHALKAYRKSIYGDLPIAWTTVYIQAWITGVGMCSPAANVSVQRLADFHESFDIIEVGDAVASDLIAARKAGQETVALWSELALKIASALYTFIEGE